MPNKKKVNFHEEIKKVNFHEEIKKSEFSRRNKNMKKKNFTPLIKFFTH